MAVTAGKQTERTGMKKSPLFTHATITLTVLCSTLFLLAGCGNETGGNDSSPVLTVPAESQAESTFFLDITTAQADSILAANCDEDCFVVLDVRTPEEYHAGHLEGAAMIDYRGESFEATLDALDKDNTYLIYCRTAHRTGECMAILEEHGFTKVYNMLGGITQWREEGRPVVEPAESDSSSE